MTGLQKKNFLFFFANKKYIFYFHFTLLFKRNDKAYLIKHYISLIQMISTQSNGLLTIQKLKFIAPN